jgi:peptide/nickel transport system ATP-binding protein
VSVVEVRNLRVELDGSGADIVDDITFDVRAGEVVGLVGESGSGKTTIGMALLGFARTGGHIAAGTIAVDGVDMVGLSPETLQERRGKIVAYVPQDPTSALNPALHLRTQINELIEVHRPGTSEKEREDLVAGALDEVKLPTVPAFRDRYPHQLSGGQQQRIALAMAFILRPKAIVLDEPTTGLDVTTQAHVLGTVRELCRAHKVAAIYITHDLAVLANLADRVFVAYAGRIVEEGDAQSVFQNPLHPYTRRLLASIPRISGALRLDPIPGYAPAPGTRPSGCAFAPRCSDAVDACSLEMPIPVPVGDRRVSRCLRTEFLLATPISAALAENGYKLTQGETLLEVSDLNAFYGHNQVLHDVSITVHRKECLALVGESGSGKTTLARSIIGLVHNWRGSITYDGNPLAAKARQRPLSQRRALHYIFQNPYNSLNPRRTVADSISLPLKHFYGMTGKPAQARVDWALSSVSLPLNYARRYPSQLSGGERQRVAIARALVCEPKLLICDEITSALDVSVQAAIVKLLDELQREHELALLFVTHNLALVRTVADRITVMNNGRVVEYGKCDAVLDHPSDTYTKQLIGDTPSFSRTPASVA